MTIFCGGEKKSTMRIKNEISQEERNRFKLIERQLKDALGMVVDVDPRLMSSNSRTREMSDMRAMFCNFMYSSTQMSVREIASRLKISHPAVIKAIKTSKNLFETDDDFREKVQTVIALCEANLTFSQNKDSKKRW